MMSCAETPQAESLYRTLLIVWENLRKQKAMADPEYIDHWFVFLASPCERGRDGNMQGMSLRRRADAQERVPRTLSGAGTQRLSAERG